MSNKRDRENEEEEEDDIKRNADDERIIALMLKWEKTKKAEEKKDAEINKFEVATLSKNPLRSVFSFMGFGFQGGRVENLIKDIIGDIASEEYTETHCSASGQDGPKNVRVFEFFIPYPLKIDANQIMMLRKATKGPKGEPGVVYSRIKEGRRPGEQTLEIHSTDDKLAARSYFKRELEKVPKQPLVFDESRFSPFMKRFMNRLTSQIEIKLDDFPSRRIYRENEQLCVQPFLVTLPIDDNEIMTLKGYNLFYNFSFQAQEDSKNVMLFLEIYADEGSGQSVKRVRLE